MKDMEMQEAVMDIFESLPEDVQQDLLETMKTSDSAEEAIRRIMVGDCPVCGSKNTRDCSDTPLDSPTVGICLDCHAIGCVECGEIFGKGQTSCKHWEVCKDCKFPNGDGSCDVPIWDCSIITDWKNAGKETI